MPLCELQLWRQLVQLANHEGYICWFLVVNTDTGCLQTTGDNADGWDAAVPVVPSTAPSRLNHTAGSTCHGGQMPHFTLPPFPCQQSPENRNGLAGSVSRFYSAPQLGKQRKRKGAIEWCNCSTMQTCQLHKAQANFRKSLRRGFLSPLAAQDTSEGHFSPCEARGWHPASSQVTPCTF